jgi:hypothetical protein
LISLAPSYVNRVVVLSDALRTSPQEGTQVLAVELARHCAEVHDGEALAPIGEHAPGFLPVLKGRFFGLVAARTLLRYQRCSIIYLPQNGLTLATILRALLISLLINPTSFDVVVLQHHITPMPMLRVLAKRWSFVVATLEQQRLFQRAGLHARLLVPRVSATKVSVKASRQAARESLGWDDTPHYLHVGHARHGRNLRALDGLREYGTLHIVLSDYQAEEEAALPDEGDRLEVHRGLCSDLGDRYRAADVYVFPTVDGREVIGAPMSIFEALANGTPVVARRSAAVERWTNQPELHLADNDQQLIHMTVSIGSKVREVNTQAAAASSSDCFGDLSPCRHASR